MQTTILISVSLFLQLVHVLLWILSKWYIVMSCLVSSRMKSTTAFILQSGILFCFILLSMMNLRISSRFNSGTHHCSIKKRHGVCGSDGGTQKSMSSYSLILACRSVPAPNSLLFIGCYSQAFCSAFDIGRFFIPSIWIVIVAADDFAYTSLSQSFNARIVLKRMY